MIGYIILAVLTVLMLVEDKFTRYRILEVNTNGHVKYKLQKTCCYIFWMDMWYSISPYSECYYEYDDLAKAKEMLNCFKCKSKTTKRVIPN